jgi:hypothetical protein
LVHEWLARECVLVVCQNDSAPSKEEWTAYLTELRRLATIEHRVLLYTEIHVTRSQQAELEDATRSQIAPRVAVISPSNAVRFVATMFTLTNRNIRFFSPVQYAGALTHLKLKPREIEPVTHCYGRLMESVGARKGAEDTARGLGTQ